MNGADLIPSASSPTTGHHRKAPSRANEARTWAGLFPNVVEFEAASPVANFGHDTEATHRSNASVAQTSSILVHPPTLADLIGQKPSVRNVRQPMKTPLIILSLGALLCGCQPNQPAPKNWEYRTEIIESDPAHVATNNAAVYSQLPNADISQAYGTEKFGRFAVSASDYAKLGRDGWELVSVVPQTETVWPMLKDYSGSSSKYPNTRTSRLILFFKRPAR
jgi:hypothetical protein